MTRSVLSIFAARFLSLLLAWAPLSATANAQFRGGSDPFAGNSDPEVKVSAQADRDAVTPGGRLVLAVILDHAPGYHSNLNQPVVPPEMEGFTPVATEITILRPALEIGPIQWPQPKAYKVNFTGAPVDYLVYSGKAVAFVPIRLPASLTPGGTLTIELELAYQACDSVTCLMPETVPLTVSLPIVQQAEAVAPDPLFGPFDATVFERPWNQAAPAQPGTNLPFPTARPGFAPAGTPTTPAEPSTTALTGSPAAPPASPTFFGLTIPAGGGALALIIIALFGAAGGLVLNLTPCVLPVIPIKVLTLSRHAGENRVRALVLGLWMALGVTAFWAALALPVLTLQGFTDPSRIFGIWWLTVGIGLLIALMSLGLMGLFQITLPQKVYMVNPRADTAWGSFVFGVMTAILGLPCFGFVAGALVPAALTQGPAFVVTLFTSMGVGMALPYLLLPAFPGLIDRLPRTGPASELVKQIMGLLLLAAAAYFIGSGLIALVASKPWLAKLLHIWVAALFGIAAGVWMLCKTFMITRKPRNRLAFSFLALLIAGLGVLVAQRFTADARHEYEIRRAAMQQAAESGGFLTTVWNDYSPALMDRALAEGKVVILDFTAEWCINCKVLEKTVLGTEPVRSQLQASDTVMVKVDLTGKNPEGEAALHALGRTGIPTLAVFGPGLPEPWVSSAYTPDQVMRAIEQARAGVISRRSD